MAKQENVKDTEEYRFIVVWKPQCNLELHLKVPRPECKIEWGVLTNFGPQGLALFEKWSASLIPQYITGTVGGHQTYSSH